MSNVRARYRGGGVDRVLKDKVQQNRRRKLKGEEAAVLVAIACRPVPEGHDHWTWRLLRDKLIELDVVEPVSAATLQDRLKKMNLSRGGASTGASRKRST